jgi:hypothetical protein
MEVMEMQIIIDKDGRTIVKNRDFMPNLTVAIF